MAPRPPLPSPRPSQEGKHAVGLGGEIVCGCLNSPQDVFHLPDACDERSVLTGCAEIPHLTSTASHRLPKLLNLRSQVLDVSSQVVLDSQY